MKNYAFRRKTQSVAVALLAVGSLFSQAMADDLNLPPWQRGSPGTTYQQWEFSTADATAPDTADNPYGRVSLTVTPGAGQAWLDSYPGAQGVWPLSGVMQADIPNSNVENPLADIWVQVTWTLQPNGGTGPQIDSSADGNFWFTATQVGTDTPVNGGSWFQSTYEIQLEPNPPSEYVRIQGGVLVDELVIDTICVPEPAITSFLIVGGLALLARRRRAV